MAKRLEHDWSNIGPIVYGLHSGDGKIVYIGATRNPAKRFAVYRRAKCHNASLSSWLKKNANAFVTIIHRGIEGMFDAERKEIASRGNLFNLVGGGDQAWRKHVSKPWMGGTGILCPSAIALTELAKAKHPCHNAIKGISDAKRACMSDAERIAYEVNIAVQISYMTKVKRWIDVTSDKMIVALGAENANR